MIGLELDGHVLDAQGEQANAGQRVWCRVRACGEVATHGEHCEDHGTPEVHAMARPHAYVYQGRRIVLESRPWSELDEVDDEQGAVGDVVHPPKEMAQDDSNPPISAMPQVDDSARRPPGVVHRTSARPCWAWCGRPGPAPGCHPASRYSPAPTFPCLACGREIHSCEGDVLLCRDACAEFVRMLEALGPAQAAAAWFTDAEWEAWEERAALLQDGGLRREVADRQALLGAWRAKRSRRVPDELVQAPGPTVTPAEQRQLALFGGERQ